MTARKGKSLRPNHGAYSKERKTGIKGRIDSALLDPLNTVIPFKVKLKSGNEELRESFRVRT
jgi:hypothetical protein